MSHVDFELSARFARGCTTAAFGYARAASAAYAAFANQTLDFWTRAATGQSEQTARPSAPYLVTGPRPYRTALAPSRTDPAAPTDFSAMAEAWFASPMMAPVRAWRGMFPLEGNPASWPMAYAMMTAGVPRAVALPAAEANAAALDAADAAQTSIDRAFASYRSDNGFAATTAIASSKALVQAWIMAPLAPLTMAARLPWAA